MNWLSHLIGIDDVSGPWYGFWSGFGSDLSEFAIVGGVGAVLRHLSCEIKGCWRLGRHATAAGHRVCRRHHPDGHLTPERVIADHNAAKEGQ